MRVKRTSKARIEPEMRNMAIERYAKDASTDLPAGRQASDFRRQTFNVCPAKGRSEQEIYVPL